MLKTKMPAQGYKTRRFVLDCIFYFAGSVIYALSVNIFTAPNNIAPGGITGLATLANYLFKLPIGIMVAVMNIPLLLAAWRRLGAAYVLRTAIATAMVSLLIDILSPFLPHFKGDIILSVIYGGVLAGAGLGLIYMRGGTTGGSELMARLLERALPHISIGRIILAIDTAVVILAAIVYRNIESALYAMVMIFVASSIMDAMIYGRNKGKLLLIFTADPKALSEDIIAKLGRGVTLLDAVGAYTSLPRPVVMCAVRPQEVYQLHTMTYERDPDAFIIVTTADEVMGKGFNTPN